VCRCINTRSVSVRIQGLLYGNTESFTVNNVSINTKIIADSLARARGTTAVDITVMTSSARDIISDVTIRFCPSTFLYRLPIVKNPCLLYIVSEIGLI